ncbi:zinc transporter ZIP3-like [Argiope bruennichi]|uniref:Zinc transporter ZIP3 n=1 Tax=Argiope bruennichi TaxID=94029 RepID=A0A8T0FFS5_ARGBR|nr:zinc transporter ZIP3-like [Argiope bruennichi]KAF8790157.1 Zinc transporter ZIP3 like protein [Argiope bruennichi]
MDNQLVLRFLRAAFIICLYLLTFASYLTPVLVTKYWKSQAQSITSPDRAIQSKQYGNRIISWFNCTAIGIFLSMCFLGILPNVKDMFATIFQKADANIQFPVAECVIVFGFIITLLLEQSILAWQERKESHLQDDIEQNQGLLEECEMQDLSDEPSYLREDHEQSLVDGFQSKSSHLSNCDEENINDDISIDTHIDHGHGHNHMSLLVHRGSGFAFFILLLACGLHSIFAGITLGLQTIATKAVHLFIAIIIHESLMAIALGINSTKLRYSFGAYLRFAIGLSAIVPFGVIIGILVQHAPGIAGEITSAFLQGLSAGIFLHHKVTFS